MTIESGLEDLVKRYATYDEAKKCYVSKLGKSALLKLDADFSKFLNQQLLSEGPGKEHLAKNYRILALYFHSDKSPSYLPTVKWLEDNLSEGRNDGRCFKTLHDCYEKLETSEKYKKINFKNINNKEDFRKWLVDLKSQSGTYTGRSFFDSLIDLLDESCDFFDATGNIKPKGLRALITFMPMIFASYGTVIFAQQLFAVYALYFLMLKGGQYLEHSDLKNMKSLGKTLQDLSIITATATTTLLVRLLEMTVWVSHQCLDVGLQIGSSILGPLISGPIRSDVTQNESATENLCRNLILASQNLSEGIQFKHPELKVIAAPLEAYYDLNKQQFLRNWRLGWTKGNYIEGFLFKMRVLDLGPEPIEEKLATAQKKLEELKNNKVVYTEGGNTAKAIDTAEKVINLLTEHDSSSMQLAVYKDKSDTVLDDMDEQNSNSM